MCNSVKGARFYEWFVPFFGLFLEAHRNEYRAANPDDWSTTGAMTRMLHDLQHAEALIELDR
jgi:hypothetical protein